MDPPAKFTSPAPEDSTVPDLPIAETTSQEASETIAVAQTDSPTDRSKPLDTEHVDDCILQISGSGTLVPRGMDRRPFG